VSSLSSPQTPPLPEDRSLNAAILRHIQLILDLNRGNKLRSARQLGISRSTLYRILAGEDAAAAGLVEKPQTKRTSLPEAIRA
jgi:DNA-binding NtrC family response regulator